MGNPPLLRTDVLNGAYLKGTIYKGCPRKGEGELPKSRHSRGDCGELGTIKLERRVKNAKKIADVLYECSLRGQL